MPSPLRGPASPVVPSAVSTTPAPSAPAPASPIATPVTAPVDAMTPARPSRVERLKGKAVAAAWDQVADRHSVGKGVSFGNISGNVKLSEEIAVRGTDTFQALVAPDARRAAVAQANPDTVWVKTTGALGVSAGLPLGAGAQVGFSGGVEVTAIAAHDVRGAGDVRQAVAAQAKAMVLPLDAEGLQGLGARPGSEWMFRGTASGSASVGLGASTTVGVDRASVTASVGASVSAAASGVFTKNVKVLEDGKVFVAIGREDARSLSGAVGVNVGTSLEPRLAGLAGRAADRVAGEVEDATRITSSVNVGAARGQKVMGVAVLDLTTPAGRSAYDYLIQASPTDAADYLQRTGLGVRYDEKSSARTSSATLQFGSTALLATSTLRGTTSGVIEAPGATTTLAQTDYARSVGGLLPRLLQGEERSVQVRAGSLSRDGVTTDAVAVALSVKDRKLTPAELAQVDRFAKAMGLPLDGLPTLGANEVAPDARMQVQVALTDANVDAMRAWDEQGVRFAFAAAHREIDAGAALPPWYEDGATFAWYASEHTNNYGGDPQRPAQLAREYRGRYGRDLEADIASQRAIDLIVKQLDRTRGKPVAEWGPLLEAVGKQSSDDVRAAVLALRRLSGAEIVELSLSAKGVTAAAKPEAVAPKTLAEVVGPVLAPPA